ncbi:MAG: ABC transporter substrate-binding protein [Pseudomonadota bacterium]
MPLRAALLLILCLFVTPSAPVLADEQKDRAVEHVMILIDRAHRALQGRGNAAELRNAIDSAIAFNLWVAGFTKKHRDAFTPRQLLQFRALLPGYLAQLYRKQFDMGLKQRPVLGKVRKVRRNVVVTTIFKRRNSRKLPIGWVVREIRGAPKIIDIVIGGVSFFRQKREEFRGIIKRRGAEGLLEYLRRNSL